MAPTKAEIALEKALGEAYGLDQIRHDRTAAVASLKAALPSIDQAAVTARLANLRSLKASISPHELKQRCAISATELELLEAALANPA